MALPVVKDFIGRVRKRAIGSEVTRSLTPVQVFIKILHDELTETLGHAEVDGDGINLRHQPPVVILLAGLQGVGKTTTAAKLARHLAQRHAKKPMLASLDTRRPAAILQLEQLSEQVGAAFCPTDTTAAPVSIAEQAVVAARRGSCDVLILDTAGRTRLDEELLAELGQIHTAISPAETLFVVDSMAGQDAVNVAAAFSAALPLTGVILTKTDGDARGGAALSVRTVTDKPIRFIGVGEDTEAIEAFHPDRMASRILGMGDVLSLVEEVQDKVDHEKAQKLVNKVRKGKGFDLADLRDQLAQMASMGGIESLLGKLPIPGGVDAEKLAEQVDSRAIARQIAIINSMTPEERRFPKVIKGSRKRRIAMGSGQAIQDVNRLLKQHLQMQKMMGKLGKGGKMKDMLRGMTGG